MKNLWFFLIAAILPLKTTIAEEPSPWGFVKEVTSSYIEPAQNATSFAGEKAANYVSQAAEKAVDYTSQAMEWSQEDLANYGRWHYKVETISFDNVKGVEEKLNELGKEKWELVFIKEDKEKFLIMLKKPAISYLASGYGQIPLKLPSATQSKK